MLVNMNTAPSHEPDLVDSLTARCQPGRALPREFYADEIVYRADLDRVWRRGWLFAGHSCEIPQAGDYFTLEVDADSLIVIRGEDGVIRGLHNVCRHRGSLICTAAAGHVNRLVCPYHQWAYGLDGRLVACRGMPDDLDKSQLGLKPIAAREVEGLIYISLAGNPSPFEPAQELLSAFTKPQGFRRAKIAKAADYLVKANWKLVW